MYASPLERTQETAAPIARALGLRVRRNQGLLEADFGEWTGAELKKLYKKPEWRTVQRNPSGFRFPGGESFTEMQTRICGAVDRLRAAHPGQTVVAVSHADPIKAAVAHAMGTHLDLFQRIVVSPCSVSAVLYSVDGPVVLAVNSTGDLVRPRPRHDLLRPPRPRGVHRRHRRPAGPARLLLPGARRRDRRHPPLREAAGGRAGRVLRRPARRPRAHPYGIAAGDLRLAEPFEEGWTVGPIGVAYDEPDDRIVVVLEELVDEEEDDEGASVKVRLTRAQVSAFVEPRPRAGGGRPAAVPVLRPARSTPTGTCALA